MDASSPHTSDQLSKAALRARHASRVAGVKARRAVHRGAQKLSRMTAEPQARATGSAQGVPKGLSPMQRLSPAEALKENGFTVFRNAFSAQEMADLAARLKSEAGIVDGEKFMKVDSTNYFPTTGDVMFDDRVLYAVRAALGADGRFLQVSDLHYRHDTVQWHRDSVHRAKDSSDAPDWSRLEGDDYGVVKAIVYFEAEDAAMGLVCGSHLSPQEIDRDDMHAKETAGQYVIVGETDEPNQRFTAEQKRFPFAWQAKPGDVLVFDQRLYHAGRRVQGGKVRFTQGAPAPKFTLSMVFGADNMHSYRMYSYFRYARRELGFKDLNEPLRERLADRGLTLSAGWGNYYETSPDDLRLAYLKQPETLEPLIEQFTKAGAAKSGAAAPGAPDA